ncbi:MAG: pyruvate dehydrogenase (acetyl-transferring), homodimeric type, partial [Anaerolineae bacterium]|nr:pyruvate dehydrogenase (acetyl-transferring), homodimeric type [Anaerolineae bacterium]
AADVWSVTSFKELHRDALEAERWNLLHPANPERVPYVTECLAGRPGPVVAVSDYVKALPESIARFVPGRMLTLGTDGFGRSESRAALRDFFEVDAKHIALATLVGLMREGKLSFEDVTHAMRELEIDPAKRNPMNT